MSVPPIHAEADRSPARPPTTSASPLGAAWCPAEAVQEQLGRILASPDFDASERNRRFLRYVVEEVQAGRANRIKAYNIATMVFGRDASFDPQVDAIVRIEARRLRQSLERYYLTGGKRDAIRITIPKGSYGAAFCVAADDGGDRVGAPGSSGGRQSPAVLVAPFHSSPEMAEFAEGLTRRIVIGLTRFTDLMVFGQRVPGASPGHTSFDYALTGDAALSGGRVEVDCMLVDAATGRHLWATSWSEQVAPADLASIRDDIADRIVRTVAEPFGVIFSARAQADDAVALFYRHWRSSGREAQDTVKQRLEALIRSDGECSEALACLAICYLDAIEHELPRGPCAEEQRHGLALALNAIAITPQSSRAHHALSLGYWHCGDVEGCFDTLRTAIHLNPNDTLVLAELGLRYALLGQWDRAVPILSEAGARCERLPSGYRIGLSLFHFLHGRSGDALAEIRKAGGPHTPLGCALEAAAAGQLGRQAEARQAARRLSERQATTGSFASHNMPEAMLDHILDGRTKADLANRRLPTPPGSHSRARKFSAHLG